MLNFGVFFEVCVIITSIAADYKYPMRKTLSNYTFTIYNNSKVSTSDFIAVRTLSSYHHCVDACISTISGCQSISLENSENNTVICKFYRSDSPSTVKSAERLFITKKQLYCSQSCEIQNKNPCGNCKCHPSCNSRNARQYLCNCTQATKARRSCQEHYNAGFTKTAVFLINPDNETSFKVLCEMEKLDKRNPVIQYDVCTFKSNQEPIGYSYQSYYVMSYDMCVEKCKEQNILYPNRYPYAMNMITFDWSNCQCVYGGGYSWDNLYGYYLTFCLFENTNYCTYHNGYGHYSYTYAYRIKSNDLCLKYCQDYIAQQGSIESGGYLLRGVSSTNYGYNCQCIFGKNTFYATSSYDGCYFEFQMPTLSLTNRQVWIPMMTRFASWEGNFWDKTYEEYEDGFGVANQQWLGLKNIQRITNVFKTDMRVDYTFQEDFTFSTLYSNMRVDTKEKGYMLTYERYESNGSNEPDRFLQGGSPTFQACKKWWATCDNNKYAPTSPYKIQFGLARDLVRIQFLLRTKEDAQ